VDLEGPALAALARDDDLRVESLRLHDLLVVVLAHHKAALEVLDRQVLDVEAHVHAGHGLLDLLVVHLHGLQRGAHVRGREPHLGLGLQDAGLHAAYRDRADAADFVDVLDGHAQRLVEGALGHLHGVEQLREHGALVPGHVGADFVEVVAQEAADGHELGVLGLEAGLLGEVGELVFDFLEARLLPLAGVHLVDGADQLADAQRLGQQSVLARLPLGGEGGLEAADVCGQHEQGHVGLRGASDHVLDEVPVPGRVDDGLALGLGHELEDGAVDRDAAFAFGLELVHHPGELEGALAHFSRLLLLLLDQACVDAA